MRLDADVDLCGDHLGEQHRVVIAGAVLIRRYILLWLFVRGSGVYGIFGRSSSVIRDLAFGDTDMCLQQKNSKLGTDHIGSGFVCTDRGLFYRGCDPPRRIVGNRTPIQTGKLAGVAGVGNTDARAVGVYRF